MQVSVTKKGQATIPKALREKHRIGRKVLVIDTKEGVLFKAVPEPIDEKGSLKKLFSGKTSKEIIREARIQESRYESGLKRSSVRTEK